MHVRPAGPDDAEALETVARAAWWETYPGILDTDTIDETLDEIYDASFLEDALTEHDELLYLIAEDDDGTPLGFASAQQTWADEVAIHTLYVHPDHWEEGIGTALLTQIESSARAAGADRLRVGVLSGNAIGRAFFEANGFERVETLDATFGETTVPEDAFEKAL